MDANPDDIKVYLSLRGALIDYATPIIGCRARAEDVVQEAWIRFVQRQQPGSVAKLRSVVQPEPYLYRIVRNLALDWLRRPDAETAPTPEEAEDCDTTPSAEHTVIQQDRLQRLARVLAELPERKRIAFNMHRLEGKSLQEIAAHLDISVVRAHQLVKDAMRHGVARLAQDD